MNIVALDDEYLGLEGLVAAIQQAVPDAELHSYGEADKLLAEASVQAPDIAFLDIELRDGNGLEVARKLKNLNPKINIIFVTGYSDYMKEAFDMYASGYVLKPLIAENIKRELDNLRFPVREKKRISVRTFGTFDVLGDGVPLKLTYTKSKELIAILIDARGITCTMNMVEEILWQNDEDKHNRRAYIRNLIADIRRALRKYDSEDILLRSHNHISIDITKIQCDFDDPSAFKGEYMSQYSWAKNSLEKM